jgi:hypothetical protein
VHGHVRRQGGPGLGEVERDRRRRDARPACDVTQLVARLHLVRPDGGPGRDQARDVERGDADGSRIGGEEAGQRRERVS